MASGRIQKACRKPPAAGEGLDFGYASGEPILTTGVGSGAGLPAMWQQLLDAADYYLLPRLDFGAPRLCLAHHNPVELECYRFDALD